MKLVSSTVVERFAEGDFTEYRIPAAAVLDSGTLLVAYESRRGGFGDWGEIWITLRRSTDGGKTFEAPVYPHLKIRDKMARRTVTWNNPVLIADGELLHLVFHGDYASAWYCRSEDDGRTFSDPVEITDCFLDFPVPWNICASGPGHGIAGADGRLIVPVWIGLYAMSLKEDPSGRIRKHGDGPTMSGCIYSEDRGRTWQPGFITEGVAGNKLTEPHAIPLRDGRYLFNFRNTGPEGCRALGIVSGDLRGMEQFRFEKSLPDPQCMGSMAKREGTIYFANCAYADPDRPFGPRINLSVTESTDEGCSWKKILTVEEVGGYADIVMTGDGFRIFYERTVEGRVRELILKRYSAE